MEGSSKFRAIAAVHVEYYSYYSSRLIFMGCGMVSLMNYYQRTSSDLRELVAVN